MMVFRDSMLGRHAIAACAVWSLLVAVTIGTTGHLTTSRQWQYLMDVPGGKWLWAAIFGLGGVLGLVGLWRQHWTACATGLGIADAGCLLIAGFYAMAPVLDPGLYTLGWLPWLGMLVGLAFVSAMATREKPWY